MSDRPLPAAFDAADEPNKTLAKAKQAVARKFRWKSAQSLYDAVSLATLLHVHGHDDQTLEICHAMGQIQFDGKFSLWGAVEQALTLAARLLRARGQNALADACVARVREVGFVDDRLNGILIDRNGSVAEAVRTGDGKWELRARLGMAKELAFIIELGGSSVCPVKKLEADWQANFARLRELAGVEAVAGPNAMQKREDISDQKPATKRKKRAT